MYYEKYSAEQTEYILDNGDIYLTNSFALSVTFFSDYVNLFMILRPACTLAHPAMSMMPALLKD